MNTEDNKVILVTGNNTLSLPIAIQLVRENCLVILASQMDSHSHRKILPQSSSGKMVQTMIKPDNIASIQTEIKKILEQFGKIDVLVNCANEIFLQETLQIQEQEWREQTNISINSNFFICQSVVELAMHPSRNGCIINITSTFGLGGYPLMAASSCSHAAIIAITQSLAVEWAHYGIRVNSITTCPTSEQVEEISNHQEFISLEKIVARTPAGRLIQAKEIADAVFFLASERASFITGQNLRLDGGWTPYAHLNATGFPQNWSLCDDT